MALKVNGIDHLNLSVINLDETTAFYQDLFGFRILEEIPEQNGRIIGCDKALLAIYESADMKRYQKVGFSHLGIQIENFEEVIAQCQSMGVEIRYGGIVEWQKSNSIYIQDPNGYEIELAERWGGGLVANS